MKQLFTFLKGILVGIGGITPGLSGSVLLLVLGLYEHTVEAIGTFFRRIGKNLAFLLPLAGGMALGVLLFSRAVDYLLLHHPLPTLYLFLGLVLGTLPLFWRQVHKKGTRPYHYAVVAVAAVGGFLFFYFFGSLFQPIESPGFLTSFLLGIAWAASLIVPGVDSAVILSAFRLYDLFISSLSTLHFAVLLPVGLGLLCGVLLISAMMNFLIKRFYTMTFSVVFGLFLSIIPRLLTEECRLTSFPVGLLAVALVLFGFAVSFYLGDIKKNNARLRALLSHIRKK